MKNLSDYKKNVFSQFGEDGIIAKIFEIIGTTSKLAVEFGAWDGFYLSNTANLWTKGWRGILIESDVKKYQQLLARVKDYNCLCINKSVKSEGENTLENILSQHKISEEIDFLSIDIDGNDYYIFKSLAHLRPRLIVCEYNSTIPHEIDLLAEENNHFGCSVLTLCKLAEAKGYKLIATTQTNCFFVQKNDMHFFANFNTDFKSLVNKDNYTFVMSSYDGDYVFSKKPTYGYKHSLRQKFAIGKVFYPQTEKNFLLSLIKKVAQRFIPHRFKKLVIEKIAFYRWKKEGRPVPPPHFVKQRAITKYAEARKISTFIETGTYLGNMVSEQINSFKIIISIELSRQLCERAKNIFSKHSHVTILCGDSGALLPAILKDLHEPALFWLDGHYSEGITAKGDLNTPVIAELSAILDHEIKNHVILIDDARCFNGTNDYPTISQLKSFTCEKNSGLHFEIVDDIIRITSIQSTRSLLEKLRGYIISKFTNVSKRHQTVREWKKNNGDNTLRVNYPLSSDSIVFDVGGYEGQWAKKIHDKYKSRIYIFEPVKIFTQQIRNRFKNNAKISVYNFGLGGTNEETEIVLSKDGSSTQLKTGKKETVKMVRISDFIKDNHIEFIDLMKINIEGDEYGLLEDLIFFGSPEKVQNIQVQFHDFVPNAEKLMGKIHESLNKTHHLTYRYPFVWENWELN